jgi:hypothetical protein
MAIPQSISERLHETGWNFSGALPIYPLPAHMAWPFERADAIVVRIGKRHVQNGSTVMASATQANSAIGTVTLCDLSF